MSFPFAKSRYPAGYLLFANGKDMQLPKEKSILGLHGGELEAL
jgi:hypothetical protein